MTKVFAKFQVGDLVYIYPGTRQKEGNAGIAIRVIIGQPGDEPHVQFRCPDGTVSPILNCSHVAFGGGPPQSVEQATAIVNWLSDGTTVERTVLGDDHQEWPVASETNGWVLAQDPWDRRWHWLTRNSEYRLWITGNQWPHVVTMQALNFATNYVPEEGNRDS